MITTSLMPNEIVNGYIGRLMTLNIANSKADFLTNLQKHFAPDNPHASVMSLLASTSKTSQLDILKSNTILPFRRAAVAENGFNVNEFLNANVSDTSCFRTIRPGVVLCEDCIRTDIKQFNFTYWKTFHQLPGVDWCPVHGTPLRITKKKYINSAYDVQPNTVMSKSVPICEYNEEPPAANAEIYRYIKLVCFFLKIRTPVRARNIVNELGAEAREKRSINTYRASHSKRTTLAGFAKASCSYPWLKRLFSRIDYPDQYGWLGEIDNCMSITATSESLALALALIFDSTDEAIDFMINNLRINVELSSS